MLLVSVKLAVSTFQGKCRLATILLFKSKKARFGLVKIKGTGE
jgi:hypothetical protein